MFLQSCTTSKIKIGKAPFTPFPILSIPLKGISNPGEGWLFQIPYGRDYSIGIENGPLVDELGNVHFISENYKLYALSPTGNILWSRDDRLSSFQSIHTLKGYIVFSDYTKSNCYDLKGKFKKSIPHPEINIGPDGMNYHLIYTKNSKKWWKAIKEKDIIEAIVGASDAGLASTDWNGKVRWFYPLPQQENINRYDRISLEKCFFDQQSNVYFIFQQYLHEGYEIKNNTCKIYSFTQNGQYRWMKEFSFPRSNEYYYDNFLNFIPDQIVIKDRFLLYIPNLTVEGKVESNSIFCFSIEGKELWKTSLPKNLTIPKSYTQLKDSTFLYALSDYERDRTYLQAIDPNGKLVWMRDMISRSSTAPITDADDNIYIGVGGSYNTERYLYSFDKTGKTRWSKKQKNAYAEYDTPLVLGSNQKIYYGCELENILYCVDEKTK